MKVLIIANELYGNMGDCSDLRNGNYEIGECQYSEVIEKLKEEWDVLILSLRREYLSAGKLSIVLDIRCNTKTPILALLDKCSIDDKIMLDNMGVDEFVERPIVEEEFRRKFYILLKFSRYYKTLR